MNTIKKEAAAPGRERAAKSDDPTLAAESNAIQGFDVEWPESLGRRPQRIGEILPRVLASIAANLKRGAAL